MPALTQFIDGTGPVLAGKMFPFGFITIACGAISGFHALISSGTTPKIITRESHAWPSATGRCSWNACRNHGIDRRLLPRSGRLPEHELNGMWHVTECGGQTSRLGFPVTAEHMKALANDRREDAVCRTGGAATLAVGMAHIFPGAVAAAAAGFLVSLRDHVRGAVHPDGDGRRARVGRYLLQDLLGNVWKPLGHTSWSQTCCLPAQRW